MNKVKMTIDTTNEAFQRGQKEFEVARILRDLARQFEQANIEDGNYPRLMHDINGNRVGEVKIDESSQE